MENVSYKELSFRPSLRYRLPAAFLGLGFLWLAGSVGHDLVRAWMPREFATSMPFVSSAFRVTFGLFVLYAVKYCVEPFFVRLRVTERGVVLSEGFIARKESSIGSNAVRTVKVDRNLFQRLLGIGDVSIASDATDGYEIVIHDVADPRRIAETVSGVRRR